MSERRIVSSASIIVICGGPFANIGTVLTNTLSDIQKKDGHAHWAQDDFKKPKRSKFKKRNK